MLHFRSYRLLGFFKPTTTATTHHHYAHREFTINTTRRTVTALDQVSARNELCRSINVCLLPAVGPLLCSLARSHSSSSPSSYIGFLSEDDPSLAVRTNTHPGRNNVDVDGIFYFSSPPRCLGFYLSTQQTERPTSFSPSTSHSVEEDDADVVVVVVVPAFVIANSLTWSLHRRCLLLVLLHRLHFFCYSSVLFFGSPSPWLRGGVNTPFHSHYCKSQAAEDRQTDPPERRRRAKCYKVEE